MGSLSYYPFIKNITIPYGFQVNFSYLEKLLNEVPTTKFA
jgi:hypothetical protein